MQKFKLKLCEQSSRIQQHHRCPELVVGLELPLPAGFITPIEHVWQPSEPASHFVGVLGAPSASPSSSACRFGRTGEDANQLCIQDTYFAQVAVKP